MASLSPLSSGTSSTKEKLKQWAGADEFKGVKFQNLWRSLIAEYVGTMFLVLVGCGSATPSFEENYEPSVVQIAFAFGLTVATIVQAICHVSGGHINPALTIGLMATGKCTLARGLLYVVVQLLGGTTGAAILMGLTPDNFKSQMGLAVLHKDMGEAQGMGVELLATFVLVFAVFAVTDDNRKDLAGSGALVIGLAVVASHLFAVKFTGCGMNIARAFGPAVVMGGFPTHHWIYWIGPMLGGTAAALIYHFLLTIRVSRDEEEI